MDANESPSSASSQRSHTESGASRRRVLRSGVTVAAAGLLAGCSTVGVDDGTPTDRGDENPAFSYSAGGAKCQDDVDRATTGWVHTVAHGEGYDVTFDAVLAHDPTKTPTASLVAVGSKEYELRFDLSGANTEKTPRDTQCTFGTRVTGGGVVPTDFTALRVVAGDETSLTVERESTTPELVRLPTPVDL